MIQGTRGAEFGECFFLCEDRETNESAICNGTNCDSSLIPLNRTIVVPGG